MKILGQALIAVGFLSGALVAVQYAENRVELPYFVPAFLVGVVGVVLARVAIRAAARESSTTLRNLEQLSRSLDRLVENGELLENLKTSLDPYEVHERIDAAFREDLNRFAESRETIGQVYGLAAYAEVMNHFAAGERYLNRVWSASVDGYVDEVREYIARGLEQFRGAQTALRNLEARRGRAG